MKRLNLARIAALGLALLALCWHAGVKAGVTDISDQPLGTMSNGTLVRSNLMFVLDNSGSMGWNYLPDNAPRNNVCFGAVARNLVFYDPTRVYEPPLKYDGTSMPNASFTAAWRDGYNTSTSSTTDLSNNNPDTPIIQGAVVSTSAPSVSSWVCGDSSSSSCWLPNPNPSVTSSESGGFIYTSTDFYELINAPGKRCSRTRNSCSLRKTSTVVKSEPDTGFLWATRKAGAAVDSCTATDYDIVRASSSLTTAQKTNYANWYAYYRTRMLAMRAGAGRAFALIDASRFRVGFSKISEYAEGGADGSGFLNVRDYDGGSQKVEFFSRLYGTAATGNTPLRPALARAGRYFANRLSGQSDPMQYSCQRNYTILSTDGYWNEDAVLPLNLSGGSGVGDLDGGSTVTRPLLDALKKSNTLADVAMYYYSTDLRTTALGNCSGSVSGQDVCENNVPGDGKEGTSNAQQMVTFTLGLGLSGTLTYDKNYETQSEGDFQQLIQGTKVWPDPINSTTSARIDDLWHAAVNGRGKYYSANNAAEMATSLVDALSKIKNETGSSSAAATSSLTPTTGDDWLFIPTYTTNSWEGTVNAHKIITATGEIDPNRRDIWSAADRIKAQPSRNIWFRSGTTGVLTEFTETKLRDAGFGGSFDNLCASGNFKLTQCASLNSDALAKVTAVNVVNFLRGESVYEQSASDPKNRVFRTRSSPMGDIVNGAPVYVKKPPLSYADGHAAFADKQKTRQGVLYVGANDGMLHALKVSDDETGGRELWAYVPSMVIPNMAVLADSKYESKHRFFVDGAPAVADVYDGTNWRTILIGGLGKGGRGYYALDITDPEAPPISLWEYTETDLGYTYGNPIITKNKAGTWVVAFSSGYNNVNPGDGKGHLYVLNAVTGALIDKIGTDVGDTGAPANLGKINAWVDDDKLNVASRFYGGDMLGNVWRFDFDDNLAPSGKKAVAIGKTAADQPITTKPVLSEIISGHYRYPVVSVATGRYLGVSDVGDTAVQSIYTFKDELTGTGLGALRSEPRMVKQTLKSDRSGLDNPTVINWASQVGWYVDLNLSAGERVNVDFDQQLNQLIVASNIPKPTVCSPGGTSWLYYLDVGSGTPLLAYSGSTLVAGITTIVGSTGKLITLIQGVDGKNTARLGADVKMPSVGNMRRTSWRELMN